MSYTQIPERTTDDANSHADINQLQLNIEALKGGLAASTPVTTIDDLNTWKTDFVEDFGANVKTELNATGTAPIYACRAWVNFDGTSGTTGDSKTIRSSGNVSSVTETATGRYTINFTSNMPDANYTTVVSASPSSNGSTVVVAGIFGYGATGTEQTTSATYVSVVGTGGTPTAADLKYFMVAVFR